VEGFVPYLYIQDGDHIGGGHFGRIPLSHGEHALYATSTQSLNGPLGPAGALVLTNRRLLHVGVNRLLFVWPAKAITLGWDQVASVTRQKKRWGAPIIGWFKDAIIVSAKDRSEYTFYTAEPETAEVWIRDGMASGRYGPA
jgi:hypothetical protein